MFDIFKIIKFFKSKFTFKDVLLIGLIILLFFATRLINLDRLPIFTDEGIYIHWAKVAWHDPAWRFISLSDGRQPLQTWGTIPFLKLFPDNALLAGRLFAVSTGFFALAGFFSLVFYLFGKKAAYIASCLYVFTPYFLFYDRLALMDSGINAFVIWILFLSILLIRNLSLDMALIFGITSGVAMLAKSSAQLFTGLAALSPILLNKEKPALMFKKVINYFILFFIGLVIAVVIYNIQRLSPFFHYIGEKNHTFIYTIPELIKSPFTSVWFNLYSIPYYVLMESAFFVAIVGVIGWGLLLKNDLKLGLYLSAWTLIPFGIFCFVAKVMYPRYIIFFASLLSIYFTYFLILAAKKNKLYGSVLLILFFLSVFYFDYTILFDYKNIPLPAIDRGQYITGGSSGYGIKEIVSYARDLSQDKPVKILTEGNFGMAGDVLDTFIRPTDKITISAYWPLTENEFISNQHLLKSEHVLVVYAYQENVPKSSKIKFIKKFEKPENKSSIQLFELTR
jgi:4-amino-4-deoxy-L-arabinose transferase-like glycosyltransferase